jgi:hypothetical protein
MRWSNRTNYYSNLSAIKNSAMKKILFIAVLIIIFAAAAFSQNVGVGIATPHPSAQLDISSTARGLLIPRMTSTGISSIANPAKGLLVYDSLTNQLMVNIGNSITPNWQTIVFNSGWNLTGNSGTNPANQFIGSTDNHPLKFRINNTAAGELNPSGNIFWGLRAGQSNTAAYSNVAIGTDALKNNTTGLQLTAIGDSALFNNNPTSVFNGFSNTAVGYQSLFSNATGNYNTSIGTSSLKANTTGYYNTAAGEQALSDNTTGSDNTAMGGYALTTNNSGIENTAVGSEALRSNQSGNYNTAVGYQSLWRNTGSENVAIGLHTMIFSGPGSYNVAVGNAALYHNSGSIASYNTAVGQGALYATTNSQYNTAVGYNAGTGYDNGYNNVFVGANTDVNGAGYYNVIAIGQGTIVGGSSVARFGNSATVSYGGWANWSNVSDGRLKKDVRENVSGLSFIMKLRPVTYHLSLTGNSPLLRQSPDARMQAAIKEKEQILYSGFIAQEVEKAAGDLGYDFSGVDKPKNENDMYGLRYADFVVPLVKAAQEQQQLIDELKKRVDGLEQQNKLLQQLISNKK